MGYVTFVAMKKTVSLLILLWTALSVRADDGSLLWLRQQPTGRAKVSAPKAGACVSMARLELTNYFKGRKAELVLDRSMADNDGFRVTEGRGGVTIAARRPAGLLYGAYEVLRRQQLGMPLATVSSPVFGLRLLNHWDNLDGSIERGYAGKSVWKWEVMTNTSTTNRRQLSGAQAQLMDRIVMYARANASLGINGTVLNNVNASPQMLSAKYLQKVKWMADVLRPYGLKVFLSVNFASPMGLGKLSTADPLDPQVAAWWSGKAAEIYRLIPDFGGFLVKANSEGQPGPGDYHRSHADGANMLADALAPFGGTVVWRSFVYGANHKGEDRVKQAVSEFKPCDGQFRSNVILQSKNGPLDFQPREPYAPIFDQMKRTPQMAELQITQEYLGQSRHLVYLAPMWTEFFSFVEPRKLLGIAGVANIGDDANWCGHHFSQANWYAFGRLAWNPQLSPEQIAREWLRLTFTDNSDFVDTMAGVMMRSREACVNYMMPLGLHHIFKFDHHYGPEPDGFKADYPLEWCPVYYHKADSLGVGFDRTAATGTNATGQYREPYASLYEHIETCPEEYLLWFHHVPWNHRMKNGHTLWQTLCMKYQEGVDEVDRTVVTWNRMRPYVDGRRWQEVAGRLDHQAANAREWRDVCLTYFETFAKFNK